MNPLFRMGWQPGRRKQLQAYCKTRAEFEALSDAALADIGIKRYQLGHAARVKALKP